MKRFALGVLKVALVLVVAFMALVTTIVSDHTEYTYDGADMLELANEVSTEPIAFEHEGKKLELKMSLKQKGLLPSWSASSALGVGVASSWACQGGGSRSLIKLASACVFPDRTEMKILGVATITDDSGEVVFSSKMRGTSTALGFRGSFDTLTTVLHSEQGTVVVRQAPEVDGTFTRDERFKVAIDIQTTSGATWTHGEVDQLAIPGNVAWGIDF